MMKLYSIGCPQCKVLEKKMESRGINFHLISDESEIIAEGLTQVPVLELDSGERLNFSESIKFLKTMED